jgi:uncharacterized protein YjdB
VALCGSTTSQWPNAVSDKGTEDDNNSHQYKQFCRIEKKSLKDRPLCSARLRPLGALVVASAALASAGLAANAPSASAAPATWQVGYSAHVEGGYDGQTAGTVGQSLLMEALQVEINQAALPGVSVCYSAHVQNLGWQPEVCNDQVAGTTGMSLRMEAVTIHLVNSPAWGICYQAQGENYGWQTPVCDGTVAGTTGQSLRLEALKIWLYHRNPGTYQVSASITSPEFTSWFNHQQTVVTVFETKDALTGQTLSATWWQSTHTWSDFFLSPFQATIIATPNPLGSGSVSCLPYRVGGGKSRSDTWSTVLPVDLADQFIARGGTDIQFDDSLTGGTCLGVITMA